MRIVAVPPGAYAFSQAGRPAAIHENGGAPAFSRVRTLSTEIAAETGHFQGPF